jgi:hypothetical protein
LRRADSRAGKPSHPFAPMISDLDIWRAANLLIRQHGDEAELAAAQRADLMHAALWATVWTFGPSLNEATSKGKPSGSGSDGLSSSSKHHRPGRHIEPRDDLATPRMHRIVRPTPAHFGCRWCRRRYGRASHRRADIETATGICHSNARGMTEFSTIRFADFARIIRLTTVLMGRPMSKWAEENTRPAFRLGFFGTSTWDSTGLGAGAMSDCLRLMDRL